MTTSAAAVMSSPYAVIPTRSVVRQVGADSRQYHDGSMATTRGLAGSRYWGTSVNGPAAMSRSVTKAANKPLGALGLQLVRKSDIQVVDLRPEACSHVEGLYRAGNRPFVVDVLLADCRTLGVNAFACMPDANDPLVETLIAYGRGECGTFADSPMKRFYEVWQPESAAEAIGLDKRSAHASLQRPPKGYPPLPWANVGSPGAWEERALKRVKRAQFRLAARTANAAQTDIEGIIYYGPVSSTFGEVTFLRLTRLYDSIRENGYRPESYGSGHVGGRVLAREGSYRVAVAGGKHRVATLTALGYKYIPVQFGGRRSPAVINREDADSWPNVRSGLYSIDEAVAIFDRVFDGEQPRMNLWTARGHVGPAEPM